MVSKAQKKVIRNRIVRYCRRGAFDLDGYLYELIRARNRAVSRLAEVNDERINASEG